MSAERLPGLTIAPGARPGVPDACMQCSAAAIPSTPLLLLAGSWPKGLGGSAFFTGPQATVGFPIWGSPAVLWRIDLGRDGATLRKEVISNPAAIAAEAVNDGVFQGILAALFRFRDAGSGFFLSAFLGVQDMQNIAPIPLAPGLMLATADNGRPGLLDPDTMKAIQPLGLRSEWKAALNLPWPFPMIVTSAHPVLDRGFVYSTNFMPESLFAPAFTHLVRWRVQTGAMEHFRLVDPATGAPIVIEQTLHQIQVTERYVVLLESAFRVNLFTLVLKWTERFGLPEWALDALTSSPNYPYARFWIVEKSALGQGGTPEAPVDVPARPILIAGESWHFAANYDDADGIQLFCLHTPIADIAHYFGPDEPMLDGSLARPALNGWFNNYGLRAGELGLHRIHLDTGVVDSVRVADERYTWGLAVQDYRNHSHPEAAPRIERIFLASGGFEFSGIPKSFYRKYKTRAPALDELPRSRPGAVFALDTATHAIDGWNVPSGWISFAPTYLPPMAWSGGVASELVEAPDTDGHVIVVAISDPTSALPAGSSGCELWIFDAAEIARGPVCRLGLPDLAIGTVVHSCFVPPHAPEPRAAPYPVERDFDLHDMKAAYDSLVPTWMPLRSVGEAVVQRIVQWPTIAEMFIERIYPVYKALQRDRG